MNEETRKQITTKLGLLAIARAEADAAHKMKQHIEQEFWAQPENIEVLNKQAQTKTKVSELESELRDIILPTYDPENGKMFDGYGFRSRTTVTITNEKDALQWCLRNFTPALSLNKKVFETAVKAGSIPDELATVETSQTVIIAQDLSSFVEE